MIATDRIASRHVLEMFGSPSERRAVARLLVASARAARFTCTAPAPANCSITRHLRLPWIGGLPALARAAGVDRIEPGARSHFPSCFAPAVDAGAVDFLTAAIAA